MKEERKCKRCEAQYMDDWCYDTCSDYNDYCSEACYNDKSKPKPEPKPEEVCDSCDGTGVFGMTVTNGETAVFGVNVSEYDDVNGWLRIDPCACQAFKRDGLLSPELAASYWFSRYEFRQDEPGSPYGQHFVDPKSMYRCTCGGTLRKSNDPAGLYCRLCNKKLNRVRLCVTHNMCVSPTRANETQCSNCGYQRIHGRKLT